MLDSLNVTAEYTNFIIDELDALAGGLVVLIIIVVVATTVGSISGVSPDIGSF